MSRAAADAAGLTLGLLAGGRGSRLGGIDKAWMLREGQAQVMRLAHAFEGRVGHVLVSANRALERYRAAGLDAYPDRVADCGPIAGLEVLATRCTTHWLLTLPVDLLDVPDGLPGLLAAGDTARGTWAVDDDGVQPLVALWCVQALRDGVAAALSERAFGIQALQARLGMTAVRLHGVRFGNLNTKADLAAAGIDA